MSENSYNDENTIDVDFEIMSEVDVQVGTVYQGASIDDNVISTKKTWSSQKISDELSKIPSSYDADDITYDNTSSGLTATDAQSAIDEIAAEIEVLRGAGFRNTLLKVQSVEYTSSTLNPT